MGCPTSYEGKAATWTRGKLTRLTSGLPATGIGRYNYVYNAYGQRVSRSYVYTAGTSGVNSMQVGQLTNSSRTYHYDHAGRLIAEEVTKTFYNEGTTSEKMVFLYDDSGIIGMDRTANGSTTTYYFQRDLQGNVVAIYDASCNFKVKYLYDAWGNCTIASETTDYDVANANPIRYRGYYYDSDTGLYYLNSRYYSPKWRRFISPDSTEYINPETVNGLNLYVYANNNPVSVPAVPAIGPAERNMSGGSGHISFTSVGNGGNGLGWIDGVSNFLSAVGSQVGAFLGGLWSDLERIGFNPFNSSEAAVLESTYFSFYKGQFVLRADLSALGLRTFSYGIMVLDRNENKNEYDLVKHEFGHFLQMKLMGLREFNALIPLQSMIIGSIPLRHPYAVPWECGADLLGGVNREGRAFWSDALACLYLLWGMMIP